MSYLTPAQASAQFISLFVLVAAARWYIVPWLNSRPRADALIALLWVHVFRYSPCRCFPHRKMASRSPTEAPWRL